MTSRVRWHVTFDAATAFVIGPKTEARRRLVACGDRSPVWVSRREAWATSIAAAARLLDQLEARNLTATIEHSDQSELDLSETQPANMPPQRQDALW